MVVCKLFLQGKCPIGENCSFQHQVNENVTGNSNTANTGEDIKNVDLNMLIQSVTDDMISLENRGQWLLSSYAPFKEKANFHGFEDRSFEEVRFGYYTARNIGRLDQFLQELQTAQQEVASIIKSLQNPSKEAIMTISNIYNSLPTSSNTFDAKSSNSIFDQSNQQTPEQNNKCISKYNIVPEEILKLTPIKEDTINPQETKNGMLPIKIMQNNMSEVWNNWIEEFEIYLIATGKDEGVSDLKKNAILLNHLGSEAMHIFRSFNVKIQDIKYEELVKKFTDHFTPKKNLEIERHNFFTRRQKADESINSYVTDLINLSLTCEFKDLRENIVKSIFICGLHQDNLGIRQRLLDSESYDLSKAIEIAKLMENSRNLEKSFSEKIIINKIE